tara:strand:+ start:13597 stop:14292 length:696 start_codon:yes stop_codon:yes gene_type:complete
MLAEAAVRSVGKGGWATRRWARGRGGGGEGGAKKGGRVDFEMGVELGGEVKTADQQTQSTSQRGPNRSRRRAGRACESRVASHMNIPTRTFASETGRGSRNGAAAMDHDDDDFDFSDPDLDDLPAHALQHLEANAIRATQHPAHAAQESDYGLDDGDEVVNLDDDAAAAGAGAPQHTPPRQPYEYPHDYTRHGGDEPGDDDMDVDEQPRRSQAGPTQLLSRIKKVGGGDAS